MTATAYEAGVDSPTLGTAREPDPIDTREVLDHVERLSYPRRAGTPGERRAARYILHAFAALGLARRREPFPVPYMAREVGVRVAFAACIASVLLGTWVVGSRPIVAAACWVAAAAAINTPWRIARGFGTRWPTRMTSQNLVATLPDPDSEEESEEAPARVVFMAHYDTKSQVLPTGLRVGLVIASTSLCGLLAALGLVAAAGTPWVVRGPWPIVVSAALVMILSVLAANLSGDRSPGALDNATGVGTLLELARNWRPRPEAPVEVFWVATGAEEVGLDGARHFLRQHEEWWRRKPTLLINLDTVGVGDRVYLSGEPRALRLAGAAADALRLSWAKLRVLGAGMDHQPFAARGLTAVSLLGDVVGWSLKLHSPRDVPDLVDRQALGRAGRLAAHLAWTWAERNQAGTVGAGHRPASGHDRASAGPHRPLARVIITPEPRPSRPR